MRKPSYGFAGTQFIVLVYLNPSILNLILSSQQNNLSPATPMVLQFDLVYNPVIAIAKQPKYRLKTRNRSTYSPNVPIQNMKACNAYRCQGRHNLYQSEE
jgi:hypothetical protein